MMNVMKKIKNNMNGKSLLWPGVPIGESTNHCLRGQLSTTVLTTMLLKLPNGQLLVAVDHKKNAYNGVRDGRYSLLAVTPHSLEGSTPERHLNCIAHIGTVSAGNWTRNLPHTAVTSRPLRLLNVYSTILMKMQILKRQNFIILYVNLLNQNKI